MNSRSIASACLAITASFGSANLISSTFDTGSEGWTSFQNGSFVTQWSATGGNPGGHIISDDIDNGWAYVKAPAVYTSQPAQYGGTFSFDLKHTSSTNSGSLYKVRVGITGAGFTLINESTLPTGSWANYSFNLNETSGWRKFSDLSQNYSNAAPAPSLSEFQSALAGISGLYIATDYNNETTTTRDVSYIDNAQLTAVPEPATLAVLGIGTALLSRRRRK